jgi:HAD superfamily hydrolase (TIGR01484 family)
MNQIKRALIFDLDGTAIPAKPNAKPSPRVVAAVKEAQETAVTLFATGRNWRLAKGMAKVFGITAPCVTYGGAQVVDPTSNKVIWQQDLDPGVAPKIVEICKKYPTAKIYNQSTNKLVGARSYKAKPIETAVIIHIDEKNAHDLVKQIKKIPLLNVEVSPDHIKGVMVISVKHIHATKFMALQTIAKKLKLDPKTCVGVGDSGNDITLLNFCGTRIAMGNATSRLKELAQHIAPPVEQDGLAWIVEKFILSSAPPEPTKKK